MVPHIPRLGPYLMSALYHMVPNATTYLPQVGTPALPLAVWLTTFDGWLMMANVLLDYWRGSWQMLTDRNCFLLDLLGAEGKHWLDWDANMTEMEVTTMTHSHFHAT